MAAPMHDARSRSPIRPGKRPWQDYDQPHHSNMLSLMMLQGPTQAHLLDPGRPTLDLLAGFPAVAVAGRASPDHQKYQHSFYSAQTRAETATEQIIEHGLELNLDLEGSPLPPLGWEKCLDLQTGRVYYVEQRSAARLREGPLKIESRDASAMADISSTLTPENSSSVTAPASMQDLTRDRGHSPTKKKKKLVRSYTDMAANDISSSRLGLTLGFGVDLNSPAAPDDNDHVDQKLENEEEGDGDNIEERLSDLSNQSSATIRVLHGNNIAGRATALRQYTDGADGIATPRHDYYPRHYRQGRDREIHQDHVSDSTNHHACPADDDENDEDAQSTDVRRPSTAMATVACVKCLMLVMVSLGDPRCPRCGTCATALDLPLQ